VPTMKIEGLRFFAATPFALVATVLLPKLLIWLFPAQI
jgi:hypothetical protein